MPCFEVIHATTWFCFFGAFSIRGLNNAVHGKCHSHFILGKISTYTHLRPWESNMPKTYAWKQTKKPHNWKGRSSERVKGDCLLGRWVSKHVPNNISLCQIMLWETQVRKATMAKTFDGNSNTGSGIQKNKRKTFILSIWGDHLPRSYLVNYEREKYRNHRKEHHLRTRVKLHCEPNILPQIITNCVTSPRVKGRARITKSTVVYCTLASEIQT